MNFVAILKVLTLLHCIVASQNSIVQEAKRNIRAEVRSALDLPHYHRSHSPRLTTTTIHHGHRHHHAHQHAHSHGHSPRHVMHRVHGHPQRWSSNRDRRSRGWHSMERHPFTGWSAWSECGGHDCIQRRERWCRIKRKCGHTKHVEERKCSGCGPAVSLIHHPSSVDALAPVGQTVVAAAAPQLQPPQSIIINAAAAAAINGGPTTTAAAKHAPGHQISAHSGDFHYGRGVGGGGESDFFVINTRPKWKRQPPLPTYSEDDLADEADAEAEAEEKEMRHQRGQWEVQRDYQHNKSTFVYVRPSGSKRLQKTLRATSRLRNMRNFDHRQRGQLREGPNADDGIEGDIFQYEDFDFDTERGSVESQYNDSYEDFELEIGSRNSSAAAKEKATPDALIPRHRRVYSKWSRWTKCSPKCTTRRYKKCRVKEQCGREVLREIAYCYTEGSFCQQWLQAQMQKTPPYELRPVAAARRRDISYGGGGSGGGGGGGGSQSNSIVSDYIMNGKGYRGPEYAPMKLKCGIAGIRNGKRNLYNMLKIIGGKPARKGEWPWQVAIINRFKEAFCGGTLIAPQWVLTAAHCVRKVLYVRIGEHNLDYEDGTELQMRVLKSFKHPSFDKKTVDSDVALLKLPKPVNATTWIGFSCLPRPYQPLPKNVDCTVIGWGKRRNRDVAGTSVLHQAEVPIIPMENCRSVYHDYTITKNMFCAGHKRGRIDTCSGDSGGPLLCRDSTKPNHPWTIFGITSFGDGCAKRNKFGIYAKVPNYVDWVWSVINCNGNCKLHQRPYE